LHFHGIWSSHFGTWPRLTAPLFRLLCEPFRRLASRIVGIVLFAIAVDFVLDGLQAVFYG
jgi:small neutral amino acid transporter SnatA (MarC family)